MNEKKNLTIKEIFALAVQNHKKNNFQIAEKFYREVLNVDPGNFETIFLLGTLSIQIKKLDPAKELLQKAIQIKPDYAEAHYNLGLVFDALREFKNAINCYKHAIKNYPDHVHAYNNLGISLKELGEYKEAIIFYQKAIQIKPEFAKAHYNLGNLLQELGELQKAISCYEKAIKIDQKFSNAYLNLGNSLKETGESQKAIDNYKKALELEPDSIEAQGNISHIYISQLDNLKEATSSSYKALKIYHKTFKFINQRISLYRLKHDVQQSEYLISKNYNISGIDTFQKIGRDILQRKENRDNYNQRILLNHDEINSLLPFYKAKHLYEILKAPKNCINPNKNWQDVEEQYLNSSKQIIYIDNFLSDEAIKELRTFCLLSRIWNKEYKDKYLGAYSDKGFISPIHFQIAIDLKQKLPKLFGQHKLGKFWAFKYDTTLGKGINIHADFAIHNLNFWITPDKYNNGKDMGGLKVYDAPAPDNWTFQQYNKKTDEIYKFLKDNNANCTNVPYKYNRAVLFNSAYFHETDKINFEDRYEGRRINITYLFGTRLVKKTHKN